MSAAKRERPAERVEAVLATARGLDFGEVYRDEYASLVRLAWALAGDRAAAEDLVQEAFLRAHERWHRIGAYDRPGAWVRRVALNLATSRLRRLRREAATLARLGTARSEQVLDGSTEEFWAAVRSLPRRQAQVVALYYLDDQPVAAIADTLGVAEGTVRATLHQARRALAKAFEESEED